jgi:hypothetical protein
MAPRATALAAVALLDERALLARRAGQPHPSAAAEAMAAAGGQVHALDGKPTRHGKPGFENPHFVASGAR